MEQTLAKTRNSQRGFSLIEILIVITLIALGGTFVVNNLIDRMNEANVESAKVQIRSFKQLLEDYRRYCSQYPTTEQGLDALVAKPGAPDCPNYPANGFLSGGNLPKDSWGTPFDYQSDGTTFVIISYGLDRKEGGEAFNKDLKSNEL